MWAVTAVTPLAEGTRSRPRGTPSGSSTGYFVLLRVQQTRTEQMQGRTRPPEDGEPVSAERSSRRGPRAGAARVPDAHASRRPGRAHHRNRHGREFESGFVDRGSSAGVKRGMAVVTPDGIVGKVVGVYIPDFQVLLITDPTFAAGVISQKNRVHGNVEGHGTTPSAWSICAERREGGRRRVVLHLRRRPRVSERVPVGQRQNGASRARRSKRSISIRAALQNGLEEVLIVLEGVHQPIPELPAAKRP